MAFFVTVRNNLAAMGFVANQHAISTKQWMIAMQQVLGIILQCLHLAINTHTPKEHLDLIFMITVGILFHVAFLSSAYKTASVFVLIDDLEQTINERKFF